MGIVLRRPRCRAMPPPLPTTLSQQHTRIGVVGDIHTALDKLQWALALLKQQGVEQIFATGDIVDGPRSAQDVVRACALLRDAGVITVLGNHDRWLLDEQQRDLTDATFAEDVTREARAYLQALPASVELLTPRGWLLLGHGLGSNDMSALYPHDHGPALANNTTLQAILQRERYRFVVSGHTHLRMVRGLAGVTFINAGALHYTREPCCVVLDFAKQRAQFYDHSERGFLVGPGHDL
jgi:predicted phosphodiesterase